jgi:vitamin B12 transporter
MAAALGVLATSTPALAQDDSAKIVVTATRAALLLDRVDSSVTVLDKKAIDASQDMEVTGLLLRTPGISMSRTGGIGSLTSVRLRGAEGDQSVIVLDGVKLTDPASTDSSYNMANLLTGDISRIEVLRGPQSTLWGSQAMAGVVNIVTASPTEPLQATFDIEGGARSTASARGGLGGKTGPLAWRLAGQAFATDGICSLDSSFGGIERDGYRNQSLSGRMELALSDQFQADVRGFYAHGRTETDGFDPFTFALVDTPEFELNNQWLGYAGVRGNLLGGRLQNRIGFSYTETRRRNVDPRIDADDQVSFRSAGSTRRIDYQGTLSLLDRWNAVFGIEHEWSRFTSIAPQFQAEPDTGRADLTDGYFQINGEIFRGFALTGGARYNHHENYGGRFLFTGGASWRLGTGTVLRARYGEGFKAPSLYQLHSQYGNEGLDPTSSRGWEAGIAQHLANDRVVIGAAYFERSTRDLISFNSCFGVPPGEDPLCDSHALAGGYYINIGRSFVRGVELTGSVRPFDGLSLDANYSRIEAESRSTGTEGNWLPRRPRQQGNATLTYRWPFDLTTAVAVRWAGPSFDDLWNTRRLDGYALVDLRLELPAGDQVTLFARAENVADKQYQTVYQYGQLGRSIYVGARGRF